MTKKTGFFLIFLLIPLFVYSIKFRTITTRGEEIVFQAIFDTGFSAVGISDGVGVTDYQTVFFKPAFHLHDFGVGLDFDFRFRLFAGEIKFKVYDWYVPNDPVRTFFLYMDKIDYIKYGDKTTPIFAKIGKSPMITLGTGFLVKDFHNHSFLPTSKEQGLIFKFNGNNLSMFSINSIPLRNIPLEATFMVNDLLDPDIFLLEGAVDILKFTKYQEKLGLKFGGVFATDLNATESNRLSSLSSSADVITDHRNLTNVTNTFSSLPLMLSLYGDFTFKHIYFGLNIFEETGFLFDLFRGTNQFNFGFGIKAGGEVKFVNLKKSGYLVGILTGFMAESSNYVINYFSSNYEVARKKQFIKISHNTDYTFYILAGFGLYAFYERLQFKINFAMPIVSQFAAKISSKFIMEDTVVPGLDIGVYYETGVNTMYIESSNGSGVMESLTREFRFSVDIGYKFYGAKLSILVGIQRPGWAIPSITNEGAASSIQPWKNPYEQLAKGKVVPNAYTNPAEYAKYGWDINLDAYAAQLEKFIALEISFVF